VDGTGQLQQDLQASSYEDVKWDKITMNIQNVMNKIQHIKWAFKDTHNFATSETSDGLTDNDEGTFEGAVKKKRPYYYDLADIMGDRASCKPKATSYDDDDDDSNESLLDISVK